MDMIEVALETHSSYKLQPSAIRELNRLAIDGLEAEPGVYRTVPIEITNSPHIPPSWEKVPDHVEEMCGYVNERWSDASALHLAAYLLWRVNWIHPFVEGNGRTSRITSYMVLCIRVGSKLPGTKTVPEQIAANKQPYYDALDAADAAYRKGAIDVSVMESLLSAELATQLHEIHKAASRTNTS